MNTLRVLLVEDSPTDAKLVLQALKATGRTIISERVEDEESMRVALASSRWDVILSDNSLPGFDASGALRLIRESALDLPFIIVSGTIGEAAAVAAMRAGAHDYVLKDHLARLAPAIEREVREAEERAERRSAEEARRREAARFHAMIENSIDPVVLVDESGVIVYASPAGERLFGRPLTELVGQSCIGFAIAEDQAPTEQVLRRLVANPSQPLAVSYRILTPAGAVRWVECTGTNLLADPSVNALVANLRDVTERKLSSERLAASEARYRRIVETTNEGVWQVDAQGRTTFMNVRMARMLGYTIEEAMALAMRDLVHTDDMRLAHMAFAEKLRSELSRDMSYFHRDGTVVWTHTDTVPIYDDSGRFEGAFAMVLDITEKKKAEEARLAAEDALRKSDLQLRQAQKMEAVGRLAGGVAHDFNNLLSVILSYSTMLLEDFEPDNPIRNDIAEICQAGRRAAELTRQLLAFSHQQVLEPQLVDVNHVVANMERMCRRILGEDVQLVSVAAPTLGKVRVDPGSLEQVIMNLVVNARDAMPGGGRLILETKSVYLDEAFANDHLGVLAGPHIMMAVTDNGHGMETEVRERIFEPFFTTKEKGKGTGLGLSTVFGIVQQSGGSVWVYSEPGKGTTFKVFLPEAQQGMTLRRQRAQTELASLQGSETVLLVEDEEQVRVVARGVLRRYGYNVIDASDPHEAVTIAANYPGEIDVLLTDVVMPGMSGPELAGRLRATRPGLKVLCMSGYTDDAVVRHGLIDSGMAFMQKPIVPETLARRLREVVTG